MLQKLGVGLMFLKVSYADQGCIFLIKINPVITVTLGNIFTIEFIIYYCDCKAEFPTPGFSVTRSFKKHSNMLIYCSRNISDIQF